MVTKEQWYANIMSLYNEGDIETLEDVYNNFRAMANKVLVSKYDRPIEESKAIADVAKYYIDLWYMLY